MSERSRLNASRVMQVPYHERTLEEARSDAPSRENIIDLIENGSLTFVMRESVRIGQIQPMDSTLKPQQVGFRLALADNSEGLFTGSTTVQRQNTIMDKMRSAVDSNPDPEFDMSFEDLSDVRKSELYDEASAVWPDDVMRAEVPTDEPLHPTQE